MDKLLQDFRYGIRTLIRTPGFTAAAVVTLALGIGANSAIFSVVNAVVLRPLPYEEPERLVFINHDYPQLDLKASVSAPGYVYYRDNAQSFESVLALTAWTVNLTGRGEPERLFGMTVSANFFSTLGAEAAQGRTFLSEEDQPGRNRVVVLSHGLWQRRFGSDPDLLNQTITLDGESYTVVGIMPAYFQFGRELGLIVDLFSPLAFTPEQLSPNNLRWEFLQVIGRLKPQVPIQEAQTEMDTVAANLREQHMSGRDRSYWGLTLEFVHERMVGEIRPALWVLLASVGFVLLIACANVANLLLVRSAVREKEVAIRKAIGAGRLRIIRQLLTESVILAALSGGVGLLLAFWGIDILKGLEQIRIPRTYEIKVDGTVLGFTLGISQLTGVLSGLTPALRRSKSNLQETLKEGGRTGAAGARRGARAALVTLEMALALVLLIGAGLLVKSFLRLQQVDPGFEPQQVLAMHLSLPEFKYGESRQVETFYHELLQEVRALPGVESAGAIHVLPMSGFGSSGSFRIEGRVVAPGEQPPHGARWCATAGYFETMKIPLISGRFFTEQDTEDVSGVAIIDEAMARKYWPNEDPLGQRITFEGGRDNPLWREIVGIVSHVRHEGLEGESRAQYYVPHRQSPIPAMFLVVRAATNPASLASAVRATIRSLDEDLPVYRVITMEQVVANSMAQRRFAMFLLVIFAALAMVLAAVGIYGVTSYAVSQRTHEIGIRMALGAQATDVVALVLRQGVVQTLLGLTIGLAGSFALTRVMSGLLYEVAATDPVTFVGISLFLTGVATLASYIPARRATKVDPMVALRYE